MLFDLLNVIPADGRLVLAIRLNTILPTKATAVVTLRTMLLYLFLIAPIFCTLQNAALLTKRYGA